MAAISTVLVYFALVGAVASFIAGAVLSARAGAGWLAIAWPFALGRIRAAEFATESPEPAPEELYTDVLK